MRKIKDKYLPSNERLRININLRQTPNNKKHVRLPETIMFDGGLNPEVIALRQGIDAKSISNRIRKFESVSRDLNRFQTNNYVKLQTFFQ